MRAIFVPILQGGEKHKKQNLRRICRKIQTEENDRRLLYTAGNIRSHKGLGVQTLQYRSWERDPPILAGRRLRKRRVPAGMCGGGQPTFFHPEKYM